MLLVKERIVAAEFGGQRPQRKPARGADDVEDFGLAMGQSGHGLHLKWDAAR